MGLRPKRQEKNGKKIEIPLIFSINSMKLRKWISFDQYITLPSFVQLLN
jgi:hypothetical protein